MTQRESSDIVTGRAVVGLKAFRRALKGRPFLTEPEIVSYEGDGGPFVDLIDENGLTLGTALYSPNEPVPIHLVSSARTRDPIMLLRTRLERAAARRSVDLIGADAYRLCHGEADGIPRLFVDRFGDGLLVVSACAGMDAVIMSVIPALLDITGAHRVVLWSRSDADGAYQPELVEGTDGEVRFHHGRLVMCADLLSSRSLGDLTAHLHNQRYVRRWARGRVLDAFAAHGGYGLQLADAGASEVLALERTKELVAGIEDDARRNALDTRLVAETRDAAERMRELDEAGERFDIVVLHPDTTDDMAKDEDALRRRVFDVHRRALRLLDEGRLLITWPPPGMTDDDFEDVVGDAASRSRMRLQVLGRLGSGPDHPTLLGMLESRPATTYVMRVIATA